VAAEQRFIRGASGCVRGHETMAGRAPVCEELEPLCRR